MVYRLLEERSKKGAGRSMRALAWRVCAWVLPLYRNLEPITRKPLGGGSGDTSLQQRDESEERGSDLHCQVKGWTAVGLTFHCPTSYDNSELSRRGEAWETGGGPFLGSLQVPPPALPAHKTQTSPTHTLTAFVSSPVTVAQGQAHRKNVWCSMQTFHSLLADRWFGSLKPIVLSNCSYYKTK